MWYILNKGLSDLKAYRELETTIIHKIFEANSNFHAK